MSPFRVLLCIKIYQWPGIEIPEAKPKSTSILLLILGYSGPFVSDTSPKSIDREGLGESRTGTRQARGNTAVKRLSMREKLQEHRTAFVLGKYQISVSSTNPRSLRYISSSRQLFIDPPELLFTTFFSCPRPRFLCTFSSGGHAQWQRQ